ncbi:MAG: glutamine--fructose-6-phosphate transaminase (isomerizing) [Ignavibacteriales bacterium]|nr:glutamine--fructose-6-phosphate transaminase (isomerizing) [Ignavibacteriales bacterium]
MCGIVGYVGKKSALPIILEGLKRMEYRGYDSAGIALIDKGMLLIQKQKGKVDDLVQKLNNGVRLPEMHIGMGHTRWATHGEPNDINAHPHTDCRHEIAVVHNGIIENYLALKTKLLQKGHRFVSETDTEIVAHLIEEIYKSTPNLFEAVRLAMKEVTGTYGLVVLSSREPDRIVAARMGSPLILGIGDGENIVAADAAAIIEHTRQVVYLGDGEVAELTAEGVTTKTLKDVEITKVVEELTFDLEEIEKGGFTHFMLKEIHEQSESIQNAMRGRLLEEDGNVKLGGLDGVIEKIVRAPRLIIAACGTSWHAALIGEYMLEQYAHIPVEVEYASEFRYRNPVLRNNDVVILISQSGETADTLAALREAKAQGATAIGICNVVGSSIARESDGGVYIHAGPEIGVASTKAFTSQLTVLALLTILLARRIGMTREQGIKLVQELKSLPEKVKTILSDTKQVEYIASEFIEMKNFLYLGRGYNFPVALEGALKLKEISYIHAEGYPAAEMKHGPIALIDEKMPVVFIAPQDRTYEKVMSNIQEVKARRGRVIAIVNEEEKNIKQLADYLICVPQTLDLFSPILSVIPLQLLAYYIAVSRGCNVDQPRNLAKSVTVE